MADKIMHADLKIGDTVIMVSDGRCSGQTAFRGFSLSYRADSDDQAEEVFHLLSEGGRVDAPMTETFFASRFGMLTDRFGLGWMVIREKQMR